MEPELILIVSGGEYSDHYTQYIDCTGWDRADVEALGDLMKRERTITGKNSYCTDKNFTVDGIVSSVQWATKMTKASEALGSYMWAFVPEFEPKHARALQRNMNRLRELHEEHLAGEARELADDKEESRADQDKYARQYRREQAKRRREQAETRAAYIEAAERCIRENL